MLILIFPILSDSGAVVFISSFHYENCSLAQKGKEPIHLYLYTLLGTPVWQLFNLSVQSFRDVNMVKTSFRRWWLTNTTHKKLYHWGKQERVALPWGFTLKLNSWIFISYELSFSNKYAATIIKVVF